jgi:peroxiredoxin Q/BCP
MKPENIVLPNLTLLSTSGELALNCYHPNWLLIYFYPRDNTPGCTTEAREFAELFPLFREMNLRILGVSRDSLASHMKFKEKYQLPFDLIADTDGLMCAHFDVLKDKIMYGKHVHGIERSTFLIPPERYNVIHSWRKVKAKGHAAEVLDWLRQHEAATRVATAR